MTIDQPTLRSFGINLSDEDLTNLQAHLEETLEERVGLAIFDLLDDDEAEELLDLQEKADDQTINAWIEQHVPDYETIVQDELDILMGDVAENADTITS